MYSVRHYGTSRTRTLGASTMELIKADLCLLLHELFLQRLDCSGFNYFMTSDDKAHCLLVDGNNTDTDGHLPVADVVLYGATKITLNGEIRLIESLIASFLFRLLLKSQSSCLSDELLNRYTSFGRNSMEKAMEI